VSEDWLVFSPYLDGKRKSWKVVQANQKWGQSRGSGSQVGMEACLHATHVCLCVVCLFH
jgi:hypothetical protein